MRRSRWGHEMQVLLEKLPKTEKEEGKYPGCCFSPHSTSHGVSLGESSQKPGDTGLWVQPADCSCTASTYSRDRTRDTRDGSDSTQANTQRPHSPRWSDSFFHKSVLLLLPQPVISSTTVLLPLWYDPTSPSCLSVPSHWLLILPSSVVWT